MAAPTRGHTQIPCTTNQIGREDWPAFYLALLFGVEILPVFAIVVSPP